MSRHDSGNVHTGRHLQDEEDEGGELEWKKPEGHEKKRDDRRVPELVGRHRSAVVHRGGIELEVPGDQLAGGPVIDRKINRMNGTLAGEADEKHTEHNSSQSPEPDRLQTHSGFPFLPGN